MKKNILYLVVLAILGYVVYWLYPTEDKGSFGKKSLSDFAIEDTASIGHFIIDDGRNSVEIRRMDNGTWSLNQDYIAMPHHVDLLLKTFRSVGVQSPVAKSKREQTMKIIAGDTRKVQIYDLKGNWIKTWYVGRSTQSNQGTFALLETPEDGVSDEPYIIEYRGFRGYLTTRFHAIFNEWRWTGVFNYPNLGFASVAVETPRAPEAGFSVEVKDRYKGEFITRDHSGKVIELNKPAVADFLGSFKAINVEHFNPPLSTEQKDSLLAIAPSFRITVTDKKGKTETADIYYRISPGAWIEHPEDEPPVTDVERVYVYFDETLAIGQRLTFDKIMKTVADF